MTAAQWFAVQKYSPAAFQKQTWQRFAAGDNGLLIAPTGSGKTYALMGGFVNAMQKTATPKGGLRLLWITPLRALSGNIAKSLQTMSEGTGLDYAVELRVGDTSSSIKARQRKKLPEILVTTPESLHVMLSYPDSGQLFAGLQAVVVDEWHDLLPTKRGVMTQLALAHLRTLATDMQVWGISATLGNPQDARDVLLAAQSRPATVITDARPKKLKIETVIPDDIERFPWSGHIGDALLHKVLEIVDSKRSTLIFTNTRKQSELWYHKLLSADKSLAGRIALHHGSLASHERQWVEAALHDGRLSAVICTSSLDLGVDFRPVDAVIQIGNPKGIARFMQRGGRSGHAPGETSELYFVPAHAMELFDAAALQSAVRQQLIEPANAPRGSFDVLVQWLVTLGIGDGFRPADLLAEVRLTDAFRDLSDEIWQWALQFVTRGGDALQAYDSFRKLVLDEEGIMRSSGPDISRRHRQAIGAITDTAGLKVQVLRGQVVGSIDETFAANLQPGQVFWLGGRPLQFVRLRDMTVWVRPSQNKRGITPAWNGGRLPLSSQLATVLRSTLTDAAQNNLASSELKALGPLIAIQNRWSVVPDQHQFLVEQFQDRYGWHIVAYPLEGRAMHEMIAALWAARLGREPNTFSFSYNDYGFELLAALPVELERSDIEKLLTTNNLTEDIRQAITAGSLPLRQFRSIAVIAGLVNKGRPGKPQSSRHLQASSQTVYEVLRQYDGDNMLLRQAYEEVLEQVVDIQRLSETMQRLMTDELVLTRPPHATPFAFPLYAERLRERLSTEQLADRLARIQQQLERYADRG